MKESAEIILKSRCGQKNKQQHKNNFKQKRNEKKRKISKKSTEDMTRGKFKPLN